MAGTWMIAPAGFDEVAALAQGLGVSETLAAVLVRRGYREASVARAFLDPERPGHDPLLLGDMEAAVIRIRAAVAAGETICVHGDYDADGICATALAVFLLVVGTALPAAKIDVIPHGIPDMPFIDPSFNKDLFGVEGQIVLLSFGLLSPNKGIETVIAALPAIVADYPNVVYIVLGATHPQVRRNEGETYRLALQRQAQELGVESHVVFYNRFVSQEELVEFIGAADIYLTPYLEAAQIAAVVVVNIALCAFVLFFAVRPRQSETFLPSCAGRAPPGLSLASL
jgi:glycosyltransferase involved in cell wall biosynthesis